MGVVCVGDAFATTRVQTPGVDQIPFTVSLTKVRQNLALGVPFNGNIRVALKGSPASILQQRR